MNSGPQASAIPNLLSSLQPRLACKSHCFHCLNLRSLNGNLRVQSLWSARAFPSNLRPLLLQETQSTEGSFRRKAGRSIPTGSCAVTMRLQVSQEGGPTHGLYKLPSFSNPKVGTSEREDGGHRDIPSSISQEVAAQRLHICELAPSPP